MKHPPPPVTAAIGSEKIIGTPRDSFRWNAIGGAPPHSVRVQSRPPCADMISPSASAPKPAPAVAPIEGATSPAAAAAVVALAVPPAAAVSVAAVPRLAEVATSPAPPYATTSVPLPPVTAFPNPEV